VKYLEKTGECKNGIIVSDFSRLIFDGILLLPHSNSNGHQGDTQQQ
jgi:hypothetical protein